MNFCTVAAADPQQMLLMTREGWVGSDEQPVSPRADILVGMSRQMGEGLNVSQGIVVVKSD